MKNITALSLISLKAFLLSCLFLMGSTAISPCHGINNTEPSNPCDACFIAAETWSEELVLDDVFEIIEIASVPPSKFHFIIQNPESLYVFNHKTPSNNRDLIQALRSRTIQMRT